MLYQCPCHTLDIPTNYFWHLSIRELEAMCMEKNITKWKDPFSDSTLDEGERSYKKNMKTSLDDIDYEEDEEEESDKWIDTDMSLGISWEE